MEDRNAPVPEATENDVVQPDALLKEFRDRSEALDARLDTLADLINQIRTDLHSDSQSTLQKLAHAADEMAHGRIYQQIDIQAKGELGALVTSLNQTMQNLQQLDASVKHQSTQVPELAAQLDAITADTETATQSVMNRLDALMNASDVAGRTLTSAVKSLEANEAQNRAFQEHIDHLLERASSGEDATRVAQDVLDFLFEQRLTSKLMPVEFSAAQGQLQTVSDEAFEILNTLQFQDITRQKVEKVVLLLKQFQGGLNRLLSLFSLEMEQGKVEIFEHREVATQDRIFDTSLEADSKKESVDDIIAQFKKNQG